jgi:hypothetical protein
MTMDVTIDRKQRRTHKPPSGAAALSKLKKSDAMDSALASPAEALAKYGQLYAGKKPVMGYAGAIEESLLLLSGIDRSASHAFVMIPLECSEMRLFALACEPLDKKPFLSSNNIIDFLSAKGACEIIGIANPALLSADAKKVQLNAIAIRIAPAAGGILWNIACSYRIPLKHIEVEGAVGWSAYGPE